MVDAFADVSGSSESAWDDSFFDLGGTSLLATGLVADLSARMGTRVSLQALFLNPTPAGLARRSRLGAGRRRSRPRTGDHTPGEGDGRPLFCVHPGIGLSWGYAGLVRFLPPERPVFGLQLRASPGTPSTRPWRHSPRATSTRSRPSRRTPRAICSAVVGRCAGARDGRRAAAARTARRCSGRDGQLSRRRSRSAARDVSTSPTCCADWDSKSPRRISPTTTPRDDRRALRNLRRHHRGAPRAARRRLCELATAGARYVPQVYDGDRWWFPALGDGDGDRRSAQEWRPWSPATIDEHPVDCGHNDMVEGRVARGDRAGAGRIPGSAGLSLRP
ncbi:hypothetical protein GS426_04140 [Rhodococcus hoagii]|nr:hypothetical protein [Prescottella equi]